MNKKIEYFFNCYNDTVIDYGKKMCELTDLAHRYETVIINLTPEGADINEIPYKDTKVLEILGDLCQKNNWPKKKFIIKHTNPLQKKTTWPELIYHENMPSFTALISNNFKSNKSINYYFGSYVVNSSWPRLWLSSYLYCNHQNIIDQTFLRNPKNPSHAVNLDIDNMLFNFSSAGKMSDINLQQVFKFLDELPITKNHMYNLNDQKDPHDFGESNFAVNDEILSWYDKIFIDIIYETFYSGEVFYLTEKTARSLFTKTPFIIFGPANFLKNLRKLGFKTFNKFWSEEYDDFSGVARVLSIKNLIKTLSTFTLGQINEIYDSMKNILEHNCNVYLELQYKCINNRLKTQS